MAVSSIYIMLAIASCTDQHFQEKTMSFRDHFNNKPHHHSHDDHQLSNPMECSWANEDYKRRKSLEIIEYNKKIETYTFSCSYCHRKFHSAQALGGHQNAHKRERAVTVSAALRAFSCTKHRHGNSQQPHGRHRTLSCMSSLLLLPSSPLLEGIQRPASHVLPSFRSRCYSNLLMMNHQPNDHLQQPTELSESSERVNVSEGVSNCAAVAGSPPMLDLSLKL